jgi:hypothetical protein
VTCMVHACSYDLQLSPIRSLVEGRESETLKWRCGSGEKENS